MPSMRLTSSSPGASQRCGVRPRPTPAGVPVKMTSPGSSGSVADSLATRAGTEKIRSLVRPCCICSPLIAQLSSRSLGSANSSSVTSQGPIGPKPGSDLPRLNCGGVAADCRMRSEMSCPAA